MLATQSLSDIERAPQRAILVESCQTKIFLPNAEARTAQSAAAYRALGLNDRQIETLANLTPKKHYLYTSPYGRRVFDLQLGPVALAFTGVNDRADVRRVQALIATHEKDWPLVWLQERGRDGEARWWQHWRQRQQQEEDPYAALWQDGNPYHIPVPDDGATANGVGTTEPR